VLCPTIFPRPAFRAFDLYSPGFPFKEARLPPFVLLSQSLYERTFGVSFPRIAGRSDLLLLHQPSLVVFSVDLFLRLTVVPSEGVLFKMIVL